MSVTLRAGVFFSVNGFSLVLAGSIFFSCQWWIHLRAERSAQQSSQYVSKRE